MAHHRTAPLVTLHQVPGGDSSVVSLHGEHDIATARRVRDALRLGASRGTLIVDLADCSFLDAGVLGLLVSAHCQARRCGGAVVIVNATGSPLRTLLALSSTHRLTVFDGRGKTVDPGVPQAA